MEVKKDKKDKKDNKDEKDKEDNVQPQVYPDWVASSFLRALSNTFTFI